MDRKRIVIIQGHPDLSRRHYGYALAEAYADGAREAGHEVRRLDVASLGFPILHSRKDWEEKPNDDVLEVQKVIAWSNHIVIFYPLWLGGIPAMLKGFFEQVLRPGFAFSYPENGHRAKKLLRGKSARVVVTMGMPALFYRLYFGAHSLRSLERNILRFCGISPVRWSLIGLVEKNAQRRERWLIRMEDLGYHAR